MSPSPLVDNLIIRIARRIRLSGQVQGLGVRPAIARFANECRIAGTVSNRMDGVEICIEGGPGQVEDFQSRLSDRLPASAHVEAIKVEEIPAADRREFLIEEGAVGGLIRTRVPQDLVVCAECLADVSSEGNRRQNYPFASCTICGPRYSIIDQMPYERARTRMAPFRMCPACDREFSDPANRRFHAQTNACPDCGPQIWCGARNGRLVARHGEALQAAVEHILRGLIVAIRGIGGYQLVCDATSERAVSRLRERKRRPKKPLAVMVIDIESAGQLAEIDEPARESLVGPANPIVLLRARAGNGLAARIHPDLDSVGVMLPTTPLHFLLARDCGRPLVMTSGNLEGEPLAVNVDESIDRLRDIADLWLHHDRAIARAVDDSVVRIIAGRPVTLRLARGLAPLSLALPAVLPAVAVGGQQKTSIALSNGATAILGAHLGDMGSSRSREHFAEDAARTIELFGVPQPLWIHDLHPDYFSTQWAQDQKGRRIAVQHHHAHVVATMIEHGWLDREVIGVALDGSGYGANGTIWGGEFLLATPADFRRVGHLRDFPLAGGEAAIREPWRVAVALVQQAKGAKALSRVMSGPLHEKATRLLPLLDRPQLSPRTTSAGRLFDGIASLVLGIERADFEGRPAMSLEAAADRTVETGYSFAIDLQDILQLDWRPVIVELLSDLRKGTPVGTMAMRFHRAFAIAIATVCRRFAPRPVALGGGVFQNRLLTELILELLADSKQPVALPGRIPPNDGGLAAGQLAVGLTRFGSKGG